MSKKVLVANISTCTECTYCCDNMPKDWCCHDNNPNGEDATEIPDKYTIPSWCPFDNVAVSLIQPKIRCKIEEK